MADAPPPPPPPHHHHHQQQQQQQHQQQQQQHYTHKLQNDGATSNRRPHRELGGIDLAAVAAKLRELPTANLAMDTLREHYSDVFGLNQKSTNKNTHIKAYINYVDEREVYIIHVATNTAREVKSLAPKRGNYRFFFELDDGAYEEVDPKGDTKVSIHQRDNGSECIRCKVFNVSP